MNEFFSEMGEGVRDQVTGYRGIIGARIQYLTGCNQYLVRQRKLKKDGKPEDGEWFDENKLERTGGKTFILKPMKTNISGGPSLDGYPEKK